MISVVTVFNDEKVLHDWLLASLKEQTARHELIAVDNRNMRFGSAAAALNHGGAEAVGDYIMFAHQDLRLCSKSWLADAENLLSAIPALGVGGAAGMRGKSISKVLKAGRVPVENMAGSVFHGNGKVPWRSGSDSAVRPEEVQTLDESVLIIPVKLFAELKFDENICSGWHLYGVDYALTARSRGLKAYALPLPVWHLSEGSLDAEYFRILRRLLAKHGRERCIYTTCGCWHTSLFRNYVDLLLTAVRSGVGRRLGRNGPGAAPHLERLQWLSRSQ